MLYKNDDLTVPYRDLHLWVNVTRGYNASNENNVYREQQDHVSSHLATRSSLSVLITILLIAFAEFLLFSGMRQEAIILHAFVLVVVSISTVGQKDKYVAWTLQALMLLPLLRLINFSMPVFSGMVLYKYFYIYILLFIPIFLIIRHQSFSLLQLGLSFKNFVLYIPLSLVIGLLIAEAEFFVAPVVPLIPNMLFYNMVDIFSDHGLLRRVGGELMFDLFFKPDLKVYLAPRGLLLPACFSVL